jgi:hypothetical protein
MTKLLASLAPYRKTIVGVAGAAVVIVGRTFGVDSAVYFDLTAILTALGVYSIKNG